jgi:hypothetical protein
LSAIFITKDETGLRHTRDNVQKEAEDSTTEIRTIIDPKMTKIHKKNDEKNKHKI